MSSRRWCVACLAALCVVLGINGPVGAASNSLIPETTLARHGLTRPWFTQVEFDSAKGELRDLILSDGTIYAQTDTAFVQAIDAETGKTLWAKQVGLPRRLSMIPGANRDFLAVINGSRLYVLNRINGDLLLEKELEGSCGAGPALSGRYAYVPMANGMVVAYRIQPPTELDIELDDGVGIKDKALQPDDVSEAERVEGLRIDQKAIPPLFCQSYGQINVQPLVTRETSQEEYVVWPTDRGLLNIARIDRRLDDHLVLKYRLATGAPIVTQPAYLLPDHNIVGDSGLIVCASRDGFVYAFRERDGESQWRFSIGEPAIVSPALFEDYVYITGQLGGMYCLATKTGKHRWFAERVTQFVAAGKNRIYATDSIGRLLVLDAKTGVRRDAVAAEGSTIKLLNTDTDRIYLADRKGLIQCLREVEQTEPILHGIERKRAAAAEEKPTIKQKGVGDDDKPAKKGQDASKKGEGEDADKNNPFG